MIDPKTFHELRQQAIKQGLAFSAVYKQYRKKRKESDTFTADSSLSTAVDPSLLSSGQYDEFAKEIIFEANTSNTQHKPLCAHDLAQELSEISEKRNVQVPSSAQALDHITKVLYDSALQKKREQDVEKYGSRVGAAFTRQHPVTKANIKQYLTVPLDEESIQLVVGQLDKAYVSLHYAIKDARLVDAKGNPVSIGARADWNVETELNVQEYFLSLVEKAVLKTRTKTLEKLTDEINGLERELINLHNEGTKKIQTTAYTLISKEPSTFKKFLKGDEAYQNLKQRTGVSIDETTAKNVRISWTTRTGKATVKKFIKGIRETPKRSSSRPHAKSVRINEKQSAVPDTRRVTKFKEKKRRKEELATKRALLLSKGIQSLLMGERALPTLLKLSALARQYNHETDTILVEQCYRQANLLESIQQVYGHSFQKTTIVQRDVNDLLLLDIVKNPDISLSGTNGDRKVTYNGKEMISLAQYKDLLKQIKQKDDALKFVVPKQFITQVKKRHPHKFDVAFLDYATGQHHKRDEALTTLVRERLEDNAIIATTIRLDQKAAARSIDPLQAPSRELDLLQNMQGVQVKAQEIPFHTSYAGNKIPLTLMLYHITKDKISE